MMRNRVSKTTLFDSACGMPCGWFFSYCRLRRHRFIKKSRFLRTLYFRNDEKTITLFVFYCVKLEKSNKTTLHL